MEYEIVDKPTELITVSDVKKHLKLNIFSDNDESKVLFVSDRYVVGTYYSNNYDVENKTAKITINAGGIIGQCNFYLQDSNDGITFLNYYSFDTINEDNENQVFNYEYDGLKQYIRLKVVVTIDSSEFSSTLNLYYQEDEDSIIESDIITAREFVQDYLNKAIGSQGVKMYLDKFPPNDAFIQWVLPPLTSITSFTYKDEDGNINTLTENTDFYLDAITSTIYLPPHKVWSNDLLWTRNPITIYGICGYDSSNLPEKFKKAMLLYISFLYRFRDQEIPNKCLNTIYQMLSTERRRWFC